MMTDQDPPPAFGERFFTIKEVADILRVDPDSIEDLIHTHRLRAVKVGKRSLRVPESSLQEFIREHSTKPPPPREETSHDSSTQQQDDDQQAQHPLLGLVPYLPARRAAAPGQETGTSKVAPRAGGEQPG